MLCMCPYAQTTTVIDPILLFQGIHIVTELVLNKEKGEKVVIEFCFFFSGHSTPFLPDYISLVKEAEDENKYTKAKSLKP